MNLILFMLFSNVLTRHRKCMWWLVAGDTVPCPIAQLLLSLPTWCKYEIAKCSAYRAVGEDGGKQPLLIHGSDTDTYYVITSFGNTEASWVLSCMGIDILGGLIPPGHTAVSTYQI